MMRIFVHLHCLHRNGESCDSRCPRRSQRCLVHRCLLSYVGVSHQTFNLAPSLFQHLHCLHRHGESFAAGVSPQKCPLYVLYVLSYVGVSCIVHVGVSHQTSRLKHLYSQCPSTLPPHQIPSISRRCLFLVLVKDVDCRYIVIYPDNGTVGKVVQL